MDHSVVLSLSSPHILILDRHPVVWGQQTQTHKNMAFLCFLFKKGHHTFPTLTVWCVRDKSDFSGHLWCFCDICQVVDIFINKDTTTLLHSFLTNIVSEKEEKNVHGKRAVWDTFIKAHVVPLRFSNYKQINSINFLQSHMSISAYVPGTPNGELLQKTIKRKATQCY